MYAFNAQGQMLKGLHTVNGYTYFFNNSGAAVKREWKSINGKWYYFDENSIMLKNQRKEIDQETYLFNTDGSAYTGWKQLSNGNWNFYRSNCMLAHKGWQKISGKWYFFNSDGTMRTGWLTDGGKEYYLNRDGSMQTGEMTIDKTVYTFNRDGSLQGTKAVTSTPSVPTIPSTPSTPSVSKPETKPSTPTTPTPPSTPSVPTTKPETQQLSNITREEYLKRVREFFAKPEYQDGAPWDSNQQPLIGNSMVMGYGCAAYSIDFHNYVTGSALKHQSAKSTSADEIRTGDKISVKSGTIGHAIVIVYRDGNVCYTAEGNVGSKVDVNTYIVDNGKLYPYNNETGYKSRYAESITRIEHYLPENF